MKRKVNKKTSRKSNRELSFKNIRSNFDGFRSTVVRFWPVLLVLSGLFLFFSGENEEDRLDRNAPQKAIARSERVEKAEPIKDYPYQVLKNSTFFESLKKNQISGPEIHEIVKAARPFKNLNRVRAGTKYQIFREKGPVRSISAIEFQLSPIESLKVSREGPAHWKVTKHQEKVETRRVTYTGVVSSSLWDSAIEAEMDPNLIVELAEVFAWQVDFSREVQKNDRWRLTIEQDYVRESPVGFGKIIAAEYQNVGEVFTAVLFEKEGESSGYYFPDGTSLERMFLKSPIRFGRISSRFQRRRYHPILKKRRPHLGVDYAAPRGTPVRSVGAGTVVSVGRQGGAGKTIKIRHNSTYRTHYKHLNGYAPGIRRGKKIRQGQVIGYVGSTGLATGPHLHFEFFENGRYVDPLGRKFPSADPVPKEDLAEFKREATEKIALLPPWFYEGVVVSGPVEKPRSSEVEREIN